MKWQGLVLCLALGGCAAGIEKPIRAGIPGKRAFWNEQAKQFMWAPAFDFKALAGAQNYRFSVSKDPSPPPSPRVRGEGGRLGFDAREPWAALTPVWKDVPVGDVTVKVSALDAAGKVIGNAGERRFYRAAAFNGPYGKPVVSYSQSAGIALETLMRERFVRTWRESGKPDPTYPLYRYASKLIGGVMSGCARHARQSPRPGDADEAIEIGRRAGDFLLGVSWPAGDRLEYFPPTYHGAKPTERENDTYEMLISPAEAGQGYLDLYDVTGDEKYLETCRRIARTYGKTQLTCGTWYLKVDNRTGQPFAPNELIPSGVISFLDRMASTYRFEECRPTLERAVRWMMENPVRTFDWSAQFDDAKVRQPYQNLSKHEACEFAGYLFAHAAGDRRKLAIAEEILRFAEDQFVVWEKPPTFEARQGMERLESRHWITPCSMEQYAMFEPISGSSAFMIMTYVRGYEATGKRLYLLKAQSLANALTVAQRRYHGRYPTRMIDEDLAYWLNSTVNCVKAMEMLAEVEH